MKICHPGFEISPAALVVSFFFSLSKKHMSTEIGFVSEILIIRRRLPYPVSLTVENCLKKKKKNLNFCPENLEDTLIYLLYSLYVNIYSRSSVCTYV